MVSEHALQVWTELTPGDKHLVGWLNHISGAETETSIILRKHEEGLTDRKIRKGFWPSSSEDEWTDERIFSASIFIRTIARSDLMGIGREDLPDFLACQNVAPYAVKNRLSHSNEYSYHWSVLRLTEIDDYEWVFDLPEFVPVDTKEDPELVPTFSVPESMIIDGSLTGKHDLVWFDEASSVDWVKLRESHHLIDAGSEVVWPKDLATIMAKKMETKLDEAFSGAYTSTSHIPLPAEKEEGLTAEKLMRTAKEVKARIGGRRWGKSHMADAFGYGIPYTDLTKLK